jgi:hypothetical protein
MTADTHERLAGLSGSRDYDTLPNRCSCGARWSGSNACHCGACHRFTFTGAAAFDRHRKGGTCNDPASVGLVRATGRAFVAWTFPSDGSVE